MPATPHASLACCCRCLSVPLSLAVGACSVHARGRLGVQEVVPSRSHLPPRRSRRWWINIPASSPLGYVLQSLSGPLGDWAAVARMHPKAASVICLTSPTPPSAPPGIPSQVSYMHPNLCLGVSFGETKLNSVSFSLPHLILASRGRPLKHRKVGV